MHRHRVAQPRHANTAVETGASQVDTTPFCVNRNCPHAPEKPQRTPPARVSIMPSTAEKFFCEFFVCIFPIKPFVLHLFPNPIIAQSSFLRKRLKNLVLDSKKNRGYNKPIK